MAEWWKKQPQRFVLEGTLLKQQYPAAKLVKKDEQLRVWVAIRGRRDTYRCELVYPPHFPWQSMRVYVQQPRLRDCPHQYSDGQLCLHHGEDVGSETTAVVYIAWLKEWIKRYEEYLTRGAWSD
jgi:hypothetical protein